MDRTTRQRLASTLRAAADALSPGLAVGDLLTVWIKRGDWWSEMRRGVKLQVKAVDGDTVRVGHRGFADGQAWEMKLPPGQDLTGKFNLIGDARFRRALVVLRDP